MTHEEARTLGPGDVISFVLRDGRIGQAEVTGEVHVFDRSRGWVVYVPIRGEMIVNTRIIRKV